MRRALATLLGLALMLLAAGCGGSDHAKGATGQAAATSSTASTSSTPAPSTTAAPVSIPCLRGAGPVTPVRFTTSAGASLVGVMLGSGRTGLVLGHQAGSDLCEWLPHAQSLARKGYRVLAIDFEGSGDSQPGSGPDARLDTDIVAAAEQLRQRGASRIVLVGSSMGGTAALSAATRVSPPVAAVASLSGPAEYQGIDAKAALPRLRVPVLFAASADDQPFADDARAMYQAAPVRDKHLLIIPGGAHGTSMIEFGDDAPKVLAALEKFIADHTATG